MLLTYLQLACSLQCNKGIYADHRLQDYFKDITTVSFTKETPPSTTNFTWYLNLCGQKKTIANTNCPHDSQLCGVQTVNVPGKDPIETQILSIKNGLGDIDHTVSNNMLKVVLEEVEWGSTKVIPQFTFECSKENKDDVIEINLVEDLEISKDKLILKWRTPAACLKSDKDVPPPKDGSGSGDNADSSWGWFTWLFIVFVLLFGGYIIIGAWITASKSPADFQDALHDFSETLTNLAHSLPGFVTEIADKVFGNNRGERGGYSAV